MAEGIYTEREWRLKGARIHAGVPVCWGAQYVQPATRRRLHQQRAVQGAMLLLSGIVALLMPVLAVRPVAPAAYPMAVAPASGSQLRVRQVSGISFAMPVGLTMVQHTYTAEELCRGKLLLLDQAHPLPALAPHPNTLTIATHGKGMVPVGDLSLKTGRETIHALTNLFAELRANGAGGFMVWQGSQTQAEQWEHLLASFRAEASRFSLEVAAQRLYQTVEISDEWLQEYTVELRMGQAGLLDQRPLEETTQGRQLLHFAWRNGFVRPSPEGAKQNGYRFRYVGIAHATAMTYLDVDLPTYLEVLHEKRVMTVQGEGGCLFLIQCIPVQGDRTMLSLPKGSVSEVSYDNTGYAIAASVLENDWTVQPNTPQPVKAAQKTPPKQ
ncbi:MAG: hypothetical protein J6A48_03475 [Clostridia bacterium]|nr:hypothetical protein [Clostridia bacterium]